MVESLIMYIATIYGIGSRSPTEPLNHLNFQIPNSKSKTMYYNELCLARRLFNVKTPGVRCPCRVVETKKEYASFIECSKDIGCSPWSVKNAADIGRKVLGKYTIERLK